MEGSKMKQTKTTYTFECGFIGTIEAHTNNLDICNRKICKATTKTPFGNIEVILINPKWHIGLY